MDKHSFINTNAASAHGKNKKGWTDMSLGRTSKT
jgi:hypothetical protein